MDKELKTKQYEDIIIKYLSDNRTIATEQEGYERLVLSDKEQHHYQLLATGWATPSRFVNSILVHLHIKPNGKVWLLENNTELHVGDSLVSLGIPKTDIVLGFHPPQLRPYSGYAVA